MNGDEIEKILREMPAPLLPDAWRGPILAAARREAALRRGDWATWTVVPAWWRHLFARNRVTVGALAGLWLLILVFRTATPVDPTEDRLMAQADSYQPLMIMPLAEEIRLAESWQAEPERPPVP